jgi:hypothetical membrane protein
MRAFASPASRKINMPTRLAGLFGIITPILTLTLIFVSIALSPWFNWHNNALSDMGVSSTANFFNAALAIGGVLYLMFAIGFLRWLNLSSMLSKMAAVFLLVGGVGLLLIGIFPEDAGRIHYVVAVTYFVATPLAYALLGVVLLKRGERTPGVLSIAAGLGALCMILLVPHKRWAVPEILAAVLIGAWTLSFGVKLLIEPESRHEQK